MLHKTYGEVISSINQAKADKTIVPLGQCIKDIELINGTPLQRLNTEELLSFFRSLVNGFSCIPIDLPPKPEFYRGRLINSTAFNNIKEMIYPPVEKALFGRANDAGMPMLYISNNKKTVCAELGLSVGSEFQIVQMTIKDSQNLTIIPIGEIDHIYRTKACRFKSDWYEGQISSLLNEFKNDQRYCDDWLRHLLIDSFLARHFMKKAKRDFEYKITNAISKIILMDENIDGILFPSVETFGGINLAIKPRAYEQKMVVMSSEVYRINDYLGYDIYNAMQLKKSRSINSNGDIEWSI